VGLHIVPGHKVAKICAVSRHTRTAGPVRGLGIAGKAVSDARARILRYPGVVIWFYERRGEHMRCEIRQLIEGDRFALVVTLPDGTERTEEFEDSGALNRRSIELEKIFRDKGWNGPFARGI